MSSLKINEEKITSVYKFIKEIGRGASGVCYKVCLRANPKDFRCVKKIQKSNELPSEALIMQQLSHPHILKIYDIYADEKNYFFVTDLCEGGELFDYLEMKGGFSEYEAKQIFLQMVSAIKYCHEKKIAHRDLKPQNFLLTQSVLDDKQIPNIKLIDFDLAFQWKNNMNEEVSKKEGGRVIGTYYYISPEILKQNYDQKCDIWSLGVILYILLSGAPPFNGKNPKQILKSIKSMKYDMNIPQMCNLSLLVKDLIKKILQPADKRISFEDMMKHPWLRIPAKKNRMKIDFQPMIQYSKFSNLKKLVALYIASQQTSKQTANIDRIFKSLDANMDGYLSIDELQVALQTSQTNKQQIIDVLKFLETDKDGRINYNEFIASFVKEHQIKSKQNLQKVFRIMDADSSGSVDRAQLFESLKKQGYGPQPLQQKKVNEDVNKILETADKNKDGKLDFDEFVQTICHQIDL